MTQTLAAHQDERSQHKNKAKAMNVLRARLAHEQHATHVASQAAQRKGQIGSGDRSERIRTYNFSQVLPICMVCRRMYSM